jgi:hypothetical protein
MSNYKGIKGFNVQTRSEDPSEGIVGDFYYNSSTGQFKTINTATGSWASGNALNTARKDAAGFGAGATNGIVVGGYGGAPNNAGNYVESWNGSSWTETTEVNAGRGWSPAGAGTQTAGVITGGQPLPPGRYH